MTLADMIQRTDSEGKGFMTFWGAELVVRWIVISQQGVEKTAKFAFAYVTDVADLHGHIRVLWARVPQCVSERMFF
jgi:hypothetical protein